MEIFCAPTVLDQGRSQVIKQGTMHRLFCSHAKITRRGDQAFTEMTQPYAIDIDPRGHRIVTAGDGASQFQSSAAVGERRAAAWFAQDFKKAPRHFFAGRARISANVNMRVAWAGSLRQRHRAERSTRVRPTQRLDSVAKRGRSFSQLARENRLGF